VRATSRAERGEHTDFIPVRAFAHQARTAHEYMRRGSAVAIVGRISSRKLDGNDASSWRVEVVAQCVQFVGPRASTPRDRNRDAIGAMSDATR
jgi:single-stranded DNA-binding protein